MGARTNSGLKGAPHTQETGPKAVAANEEEDATSPHPQDESPQQETAAAKEVKEAASATSQMELVQREPATATQHKAEDDQEMRRNNDDEERMKNTKSKDDEIKTLIEKRKAIYKKDKAQLKSINNKIKQYIRDNKKDEETQKNQQIVEDFF